MNKRYWCEVPHAKGDGSCLRHTNYSVNAYGSEWREAFPHDDVVSPDRPEFTAYVCGNHTRKLRDAGVPNYRITHLDGPDGLLRF